MVTFTSAKSSNFNKINALSGVVQKSKNVLHAYFVCVQDGQKTAWFNGFNMSFVS